MHRTAVQGLYGVPFGHNVAALAALVAQAPEQHRRVQAVAAHHPYGAVHIGRLPRRRVADGLVAVALLVGLVHDIQAEVVVQGVHLGVVGIVAGAHRVDVVAFHEDDVLDHALHGNGLAEYGMGIVAVGALQVSKYAVDIQLVIPKFHLPETVLEESAFLQFAGLVVHGQPHRIEVGLFGAPEFGGRNFDFRTLPYFNAVFIVEAYLHAGRAVHGGPQRHFTQVGIEHTLRTDVLNMSLGTGHQVHVAVNTGQAEHILVFQVGTVAPFVHLHGQGVIALFHVRRNAELGVVVGALAVTHLLAVHPHIEGRIHAVKVQINLLSGPVGRQGEIAPVGAHGIGFLLHGIALLGLDKRRIAQERIGHIGIDGGAVALHFPVGRDFNFGPVTDVIGRLVEVHRALFRGLDPVELPGAIKKQIAAGGRPLPGMLIGGVGHHFGLTGIRDQSRMTGLLVHGKDPLVLPVVFGAGLGLNERYFHVRLTDDPALRGALFIGLQLPYAVSVTALPYHAQGHFRGHAGKGVRAVREAFHLPVLVLVVLLLLPLDHRLLLVAAAVVQGLVGIAVHQLVNVLLHLPELPHLTGIVFLRITQINTGFHLNALPVVQHQSAGRSNLIGLLSVKRLGAGQNGGDQQQSSTEREMQSLHFKYFITFLLRIFRRRILITFCYSIGSISRHGYTV